MQGRWVVGKSSRRNSEAYFEKACSRAMSPAAPTFELIFTPEYTACIDLKEFCSVHTFIQQYEEGGQDPEAEKRAVENLDACRERLIASWDPRVLGSPAVSGAQTYSSEPMMEDVQLDIGG